MAKPGSCKSVVQHFASEFLLQASHHLCQPQISRKQAVKTLCELQKNPQSSLDLLTQNGKIDDSDLSRD